MSVVDDISELWRSSLMSTMRTTRDWEGVAASLGTYQRWHEEASAALQRLEQELPLEQRRLESAAQQLQTMRELVDALPDRIAEARAEQARINAENNRMDREDIRYSDRRPLTAKTDIPGAHRAYR